MTGKHLHIIAFDVPYPADYGGVIDIFYKIKALHSLGVKIHLHCFKYGREEADILNNYCVEINYYERELNPKFLFSTTPFIIKTRTNRDLEERLSIDNYPVLCEGMHTCSILNSDLIKDRMLIYRSSNVEHKYYLGLAAKEKNLLKRFFFNTEALKLKLWEKNLAKSDLIISVSEHEEKYYKKRFKNKKVVNLYSFFQQDNKINPCYKNDEKFILYHANLSVSENIKTAVYILEHIAPYIDYKIVIAGKNPDKRIFDLSNEVKNTNIIANPDDEKMQNLLHNAHINLMLTDQPTGLKLKLLYSLFQGKYCIANSDMLVGTNLEDFVYCANTDNEILSGINALMEKEFQESDFLHRMNTLPEEFNNTKKAKKLIDLIFSQE